MSPSISFLVVIAFLVLSVSDAFTAMPTQRTASTSKLYMADGASEEVKAAPQVNGEQLEMMLQEWDTPLVIDAYATWYVGGVACRIERISRFVPLLSRTLSMAAATVASNLNDLLCKRLDQRQNERTEA
jgi:hypothetical protein